MEFRIIFLVMVLLLAGSATTLLTKFTNLQESVGRDGLKRLFRHPFLQCWGLTVGEAICIILFFTYNAIKDRRQRSKGGKVKEKSSFNPLLFIPPSLMHCGTRILGYLAFTLTSAASVQILMGCNLIFTCILSRIFLKKSLAWYKWFGVFVIILGVVLVGLSDMLEEDDESDLLLGDLLIVLAMVFYAGQLTWEEKFVKKHNIKPMNAVGLEGSFSLVILSVLLIVLYFIPVQMDMGQPGGQVEDALDGFVQLWNNPVLMISFVFTTVTLCLALLSGVAITKKLSAVHRIVIDQARAILVWAFSLIIHWQNFQPLQIIGFLTMSLGIFIFNDIIIGPAVRALLRYCGFLEGEPESDSGITDRETTTSTGLAGEDNKAFAETYKVLDVDSV